MKSGEKIYKILYFLKIKEEEEEGNIENLSYLHLFLLINQLVCFVLFLFF
jgi:hypothetical protein